jgi:hypothetical protein
VGSRAANVLTGIVGIFVLLQCSKSAALNLRGKSLGICLEAEVEPRIVLEIQRPLHVVSPSQDDHQR